MHPYLLETFAHDRAAAIAPQRQRPLEAGAGPAVVAQRIGWMLVTVGLRLIGDGPARRHPAPIGG